MDVFTSAYIECALWSTNDETTESGGEPLDANYGAHDLHPSALAQIQADCAQFQRENYRDIADDPERAGHDFWLTRNGHGAGFWDGDWPEEIGERLTDASKAFGEINLYVSGKQIYFQEG